MSRNATTIKQTLKKLSSLKFETRALTPNQSKDNALITDRAVDLRSAVRAFSMPRFGAGVLDSNSSGGIFNVYLKAVEFPLIL